MSIPEYTGFQSTRKTKCYTKGPCLTYHIDYKVGGILINGMYNLFDFCSCKEDDQLCKDL